MIKTVEMLGIKLNPLTMDETVTVVDQEFIQKNKPLHLMGVNADKINQCYEDSNMMKIVNNCGVVNADGASVVLAGKYLGIDIPERVAGIDLMQELLKLSENKSYSVYFFGAKEEVVKKMLNNFKQVYPNLKVSGYRNGYFSDEEVDSISEDIRQKKPQIVFVGITSPKKEFLIERFLEDGIQSVFMGVGGSFDVLSGTIKRAPLWMQKSHLEWLFRVMNEPRRLFKRYFVGNTKFIKTIVKEKRKLNL
ncbi:UDP-N-acetyl-D-mannosamine transferase [Streptococcus acidominimus]|uniref:UDP-N-acetyl-D-mannosamine transferase n=1 Tax=Streptococcus acidominimus TaxID=1326 RepID=A0A239X3Z3_STRAI|nr:WecB/TagA/CpsF family glycosyltransferase [Streptococcus acidominimus]SNV41425.1 UDP-N-acetyl-D-mannosamine transferase [Streptococcus acidominimus]